MTPEEWTARALIEMHKVAYDRGRADQKREDDVVIAAMFGRFDPQKQTGVSHPAAPIPYDDPPSDDQ